MSDKENNDGEPKPGERLPTREEFRADLKGWREDDSKDMNIDEMIDLMDEDTCLRVPFDGHTNQYVYRFPSGIMTTVWGDRSVASGKIGIMSEEHVRDTLKKRDDKAEIEPIPFEETPYAERWEGPDDNRREYNP